MAEWHDIATAPRDGTTILMGKWHDGERYWIASGSINGGAGPVDTISFWCNFTDDDFEPFSHQNPTHWSPLPPPPPPKGHPMTDSTMVERVARAIWDVSQVGNISVETPKFEELGATALCYRQARAAIEAIGPELRACIAYFDGYCQDEADDEENCIDGAIQHARAVAFRDAVKALRSSLKGEGE